MEVRSLMKKTICSAIILILLALPARAFDNFTYTSSRAFSMGKAFTGLSDDESAIYYNPAGLAYVDQRSEGLSGVYQDYSWSYTSLSSTLSPKYSERGVSAYYLEKSLAISISLMGEGWWEEMTFVRDIWDPMTTYTLTPVFFERYVGISYAREILEGLSIGGTAKYINTDDPYDFFENKNGFTLDAGILYTAIDDLSIGLSVANIVFSDIDYAVPDDFGMNAYLDELQRDLSLGIAYHPRSDIVIAADVHNLFEDGVKDVLYETYYTAKRSYHLGFEWLVVEALALRAGYFYDQRISEHPYLFDRQYEYDSYNNVTFGAGFTYGRFTLDAGVHLDDRRSKMEESPIELDNTTLMGYVDLALFF